MAEIVPVDQFLDWYPGWKPEHIDDPWLRMRSGPFRKEDESRFWFVDFHWPRGFSPLGFCFVTGAAWSTQLAAHQLPLPPAGGLVQRMGGPFLYESEVPVTSQWEIGYRAARIEKNMPKFLGNFDAIWEERKWELELGLGYFESYDFAGKSLAEIGQYIADARTFNTRAWEIHFEIMYPLLAIYLQLYGLCAGNGIDPGNIAKMLQGRDSKIMETDRAMWDLADEAKRLGIADLFEHEPEAIRGALSAAGGNASIWLTKFDDFLKVYGWRTEGIADINIPSWIENQASPLGQLRNFVQMDERHDFDQSLADSHREHDEAIEDARSKLNGAALGGFNELLGICTVANFAWWNEDHNYYIDLRSSIPLRRGALAAAEAVGADTYDDTTFLFFSELQQVCNGEVSWKDKQSIATARHEYYDHYQDLRPTIPKVVGTLPDKVEDPVLIEIFGMHSHYFEGLKADPHTTQLKGFPASAGTYTGTARVMLSATELFDLEEGEILVTEATSPNWTPAFAIIGACVCDGGGSLTHAATVSREYGIPCVVGTSVATQRIRTGDRIEVDGTRGVVTIVERARREADGVSVKGKRVVVTGGARGIGARLVGELRERGADVVSTDILPGCDIFCDVSDEFDVIALFDQVGEIDGLVNNAALLVGRRPFQEITVEEWDRMMAVNVRGTFLCAREASKHMPRGGSIVNVSSTTAFNGSQGFLHYVASKGAVVSMTKTLAFELGPQQIRVNCVGPGFTPTEGSAVLGAYDPTATPLGRVMEPDDLLGTYCYLLSDDSKFVSAQTILVNGGRFPH